MISKSKKFLAFNLLFIMYLCLPGCLGVVIKRNVTIKGVVVMKDGSRVTEGVVEIKEIIPNSNPLGLPKLVTVGKLQVDANGNFYFSTNIFVPFRIDFSSPKCRKYGFASEMVDNVPKNKIFYMTLVIDVITDRAAIPLSGCIDE